MVAREYDYWLLDLDGTLVDVDWSYPRSVFDRVRSRVLTEAPDAVRRNCRVWMIARVPRVVSVFGPVLLTRGRVGRAGRID